MKKRSIAAKLGVVALALTMATTSLSSGTLAKYTASYKAGGTFTVAQWHAAGYVADMNGTKWDYKAMSVSGDVRLKNLFDSAGYTNGTSGMVNSSLAPGTNGSFNVVVDTALDGGTTEVDVDYQVYIMPVWHNNESSYKFPKNFHFWDTTDKTDGGTYGAPLTYIQASNEGQTIAIADDKRSEITGAATGIGNNISSEFGYRLAFGTIKANAATRDKTIQLAWEWPYETGTVTDGIAAGDGDDMDAADLLGGLTGESAPQFKLSLFVTQARPANSARPAPGNTAASP